MAWATTRDAAAFLEIATEVLSRDLVAHAPLLVEAGYLAARPSRAALFGVLDQASPVAAYVRAPGHPVLLSRLPTGADAVGEPGLPPLPWEVDSRDVDGVREALRRGGTPTRVVGSVLLHVLPDDAVLDPAEIDPRGRPRVADERDRALLEGWYGTLLRGLPDDATDLAFLVDEPLASGGAVLWEHEGASRGVAVRTRPVAGVTKVTAAWSPEHPRYAEAAFVAAAAAARSGASTVVAAARPDAAPSLVSSSGFRPVAERVLIEVVG